MTTDTPKNDQAQQPVCSSCVGHAAPPPFAAPTPAVVASAAAQTFRIALMDCANEESEIRRALEAVPGIRSLGFQLGARTLTIDADASAMHAALAAIRKAGFSPLPLNAPQSRDVGAERHDHDHDHAGHEAHGAESGIWSGPARYALALVLAIGAESMSFFAPETTVWRIAGMALAATAIVLAGLSTYIKGFAALRNGRLNINAREFEIH